MWYKHGNIPTDHPYIEVELVHFYKDLLTEPCMDCLEDIRKITQQIIVTITIEYNVSLMHPITQEKVD